MHTDVILTNKRRIHTQPNYTNTKLKAWFRRLLRHPARKWSGSILNRHTTGSTQGLRLMMSGYGFLTSLVTRRSIKEESQCPTFFSVNPTPLLWTAYLKCHVKNTSLWTNRRLGTEDYW